jgi:hypothetical protein
MRVRYARIGRLTLGLFVLNLALQVMDAWVTYAGCRAGVAEGNPLVRYAMHCLGLGPGLLLVKCAAVLFLGYLWMVRTNRLVLAALTITATIYIAFAIVPWSLMLLPGLT